MSKNRNDEAWEAIFADRDVLGVIGREGRFLISADEIRRYREPRLMAKFDHRVNLPEIFQRHSLAILPVSRGDYVIGPFEAYCRFSEFSAPVRRFSLPASLESLDGAHIPSETIALSCAAASGILSDFLGEETLVPTVAGRMNSDRFSFSVRGADGAPFPVDVDHAQLEIDAAYEGARSLALIEAKRDLSEDFLVRQLYYPYRVWSERVHKRVRPVFLIHSNGLFRLCEYEFTDPLCYNSLRLVQQRTYSLEDTDFTRRDLLDVLRDTPRDEEPAVAFPQANSLERVLNLCELLLAQPMTPLDVTAAYDFTLRQAGYYTAAARFLGLIRKDGPAFRLTAEGRRLLSLGYRRRQAALTSRMARSRVFRSLLSLGAHKPSAVTVEEARELLRTERPPDVWSEKTLSRRASTAVSWVNWLLRPQGEEEEQLSFFGREERGAARCAKEEGIGNKE